MKRRAFIVLLLMGGVAEALPPPADTAAAGVVRVSASAALRPLFVRWQTGFRKLNPDVKIEFTVAGSDVAMAGLYPGRPRPGPARSRDREFRRGEPAGEAARARRRGRHEWDAGRAPLSAHARSARVFSPLAGRSPSSAAREFLRYVLSPAGQRAVAEAEAFLPLAAEAAQQLRLTLD